VIEDLTNRGARQPCVSSDVYGLNPTIAELSQAVEQEVEKFPGAQRLATYPGVGPLYPRFSPQFQTPKWERHEPVCSGGIS
jgi:transposase